jgi:dihydroxyacetone kinase-like protein
MAGAAKNKEDIDLAVYTDLLITGIDAVKQRGKSNLGEKTMLDVLIPYSEVLQGNIGKDPKRAFALASEKAKVAMESTKEIRATKGRASYLGDRSIGHVDPGAMSSYLMITCIENYLKKNRHI